jgi:hypothetical protein
MPDWTTKLAVMLGPTPITPIEGFHPTFSTPHTVIHSIEADNVGFVKGPTTFTFTMTVQSNASVVADLTQMALDGTTFEIAVVENQGTDWAFKSIKFSNCVITKAGPIDIKPGAVPTITFDCAALRTGIDK